MNAPDTTQSIINLRYVTTAKTVGFICVRVTTQPTTLNTSTTT